MTPKPELVVQVLPVVFIRQASETAASKNVFSIEHISKQQQCEYRKIHIQNKLRNKKWKD